MLLVTVISNYVAHYCFVKLYMSRLTSPHTIIKAIHRRVREGLTARLYAVTTRTSLPPAKEGRSLRSDVRANGGSGDYVHPVEPQRPLALTRSQSE